MDTTFRLSIYTAITLFGLSYLAWWGRSPRWGLEERHRWYRRTPYVIALIAAAAAGFLFGRLPNPMAGVTKFYKSIAGVHPSILPYAIVLLVFIALAIIGNKIVCGWACPLGALQELIYSIPGFEKLPRLRPRFAITNSIRAALLALMIVVPIGAVGGKHAVIYKYVNAFNIFDLRLPVFTVFVVIVSTVAFSPFLYRPFCRIVCPFGFISWIAERVSLFRVRVDHQTCINCGRCIRACPLGAARGRVEGRIFPEDCFSCARCLNKCPVDAISYSSIFKRIVNRKR